MNMERRPPDEGGQSGNARSARNCANFLSVGGVEGPIVETKCLGVADLDSTAKSGDAARRELEDHVSLTSTPGARARLPTARAISTYRRRARIRDRDSSPADQPKPGENDGFARNNVRVLVALIEKAPVKIRLLRVIYGGKVGDVLSESWMPV